MVRAPTVHTDLTCGGQPMGESAVDGGEPATNGGLEMGRRYWDPTGGLEVLCTAPGGLPVLANGNPLELVPTKPLPSSD
ncbi:hypothetical protein [Amycolatopsis pithecellobii]|uniref:Uncharacterized protein n=1 Tax=Amycolatopsis pithecellobii TaxID=664692 RepID=A0A6N7YZF5_9PSEU|nr:hypothetical protein [Amycolatopsis pithecellobii]MTD54293.1 hypothetical protein [Amycolatopsis pithecellobii]